MNNSKPPSAPQRVSITFATWRAKPLAWSSFLAGRWLNALGELLAEKGRGLMAGALKALGVRPRPVPPMDPRSTDLLRFLCDQADREASKADRERLADAIRQRETKR